MEDFEFEAQYYDIILSLLAKKIKYLDVTNSNVPAIPGIYCIITIIINSY